MSPAVLLPRLFAPGALLLAGATDTPYRQRIYCLTAEAGGTLRSAIFELGGDPLTFA